MDANARAMEGGITMSGWGIAETAPVIEKIKAVSADYLRGLNSCGDITWSVYDKAFDFYMELISRAYEQGKKDAQPQWIPCSDHIPDTPMRVQVQLDNGWIITAYRQEDEWLSVPDCGDALRDECVVAWMPLPEPWRGDEE